MLLISIPVKGVVGPTRRARLVDLLRALFHHARAVLFMLIVESYVQLVRIFFIKFSRLLLFWDRGRFGSLVHEVLGHRVINRQVYDATTNVL